MSRERIYLDHNATTPLRPEARAAMLDAMDVAGNPSSVHAEGRAARALVEAARAEVAALAGVAPEDVIFTSGGTEAINCVLRSGWDTILLTGLEHDAVRASAQASGARIVEIPVRPEGRIDLKALEAALAAGASGRTVLALQLANNETGALQPVAEAAALARAQGVAMLTDVVQAAGKIPVDLAALGAGYAALSAHKLGGPKGVGALVVRDGVAFEPMLRGGGQERRLRAGTENVIGIAGFAAAAATARRELKSFARFAGLRNHLEARLRRLDPSTVFICEGEPRLPNTSLVAIPGRRAETLVVAFDLAGVGLSAGAACSSGKVASSHVLAAMGVPGDLAGSAIRLSLGWSSTAEDIERFLSVWTAVMARAPSRLVA